MNRTPKLHLASSSPRRREILSSLGLVFDIHRVDLDERRLAGETPDQMVLRLATAKARAAPVRGEVDVVVGADTAVVTAGEILGKPVDADEAIRMLELLSGRVHRVVTGVAVRSSRGTSTALSTTEVAFREIGRDEALAYWHTGEPCDKAGAYAIQGLGGAFVTRIEGSYTGVVGLPVYETLSLLGDAGIDIFRVQARHDR